MSEQGNGVPSANGLSDDFRRSIEEAMRRARGEAPATPSELTPPKKSESGSSAPAAAPAAAADSVAVTGDPQEGRKQMSELIERVEAVQNTLLESVFGQDHAVATFTAGYFQAELLAITDPERKKPRGTFLFAGPPGVGKTFLAECVAKALKLPFARFDMSEYSEEEAGFEFCGSDKVYKNGHAGNVTSFVAKNPHCVLLFDEIEKAHLNVIHLFLQMLDAARLRDNFTDEEVSFQNAIIILTTNAGRQLYEASESPNLAGLSRKTIMQALATDRNPVTGGTFFPAAICSRFASGNVVMFNHMEAHHLCRIARKEILRHAKSTADTAGIACDIDERVYSALLFAEGGKADARTVRGRAENFYDTELFELLRLVQSGSGKLGVGGVERIRFTVELPSSGEVRTLFESGDKTDVLLFAEDAVAAEVARKAEGHCRLLTAGNEDTAMALIDENDVKMVICDLRAGMRTTEAYLNADDLESEGRDFFRMLREKRPEMPLYILQTETSGIGTSEKKTLMQAGARGMMLLSADDLGAQIEEAGATLYQQGHIQALAKASKVITFETVQTLSEDGREAEIRLTRFALRVATDAEDAGSVMSNVSRPNVRFEQVIGAKDAKEELRYFVDYLRNPGKFRGTGVRVPRGVLMYGPPGTGKTMLAKAMAAEADVTFIAAEGNQFLKSYIGEGSAAVHELFRTARKYAPAILFIDEIDAIGKERRGQSGTDSTLTAFLTEMDGFKNDPTRPVFVLAATNYEVEPGSDRSLDGALVRRFDRKVYIDLPDKGDRIAYLKMKVARNKMLQLSDEHIESIAVRSTGMSLADIESILEMALRIAIRTDKNAVSDELFDEAFETWNSGEQKERKPEQMLCTARHEAGHALLCWLTGEKPSYVTIVARGDHGGYMRHGDNEDKHTYSREDLRSRIRVSLGGRAAETVYYGSEQAINTGASSDLRHATNVAYRMLCSYGMDDTFGPATVDMTAAKGGPLAVEIRAAVNGILTEEMQKSVALITEHRVAMDALVEALMQKNHLVEAEIDEIFRANIETK